MNDYNWENFMTSEEVPELASPDFHEPEGFRPPAPGRYISRSRKLEPSQTSTGKPSIKVSITREDFTDLSGTRPRELPPFVTLYFDKRKSWDGEGEISDVGRYLKACGLPYEGLTKDALIESLRASETIPVVARVGWEQDFREAQANGQTEQGKDGKAYTKVMKTSFFKVGDRYVHQRKIDGKTYTAKGKVIGWEPFRG